MFDVLMSFSLFVSMVHAAIPSAPSNPLSRRRPSPARVLRLPSFLARVILDDVLLANGRLVHLSRTGAPLNVPMKFALSSSSHESCGRLSTCASDATISLISRLFSRISILSPGAG
jgi:hypothetical protein